MIPLTTTFRGNTQYNDLIVTRICYERVFVTESDITFFDQCSYSFVYRGCRYELNDKIKFEEQEVIIIDFESNIISRFYRPSSSSNTIMLTERCDQRCIMCSQPPKNKDYPFWDIYKKAISILPHNAILGISGGEPTLYKKELFSLLQFSVATRPDITFHILTNAQHFDEHDTIQLSAFSDNVIWAVPLYSESSAAHDQIVCKPGAFETLLDSFEILIKANCRLELRTVLMQQNYYQLPQLAYFVSKYFQWIEQWSVMQLESIGFAKIDWSRKFVDTSVFFDLLEDTISIARGTGVNIALYNFPTCTVPATHRDLCANSISDWKKKFLKTCEKCELRNSCTGFFEWYDTNSGFKRIEAVSKCEDS